MKGEMFLWIKFHKVYFLSNDDDSHKRNILNKKEFYVRKLTEQNKIIII